MMMVNKLLYKVGENKENYSRLLVNKWGNEKWISDFFKEHLEDIFPTLKLLETECNLGEERLDAVCWYQQEKAFIIFEYKKREYQSREWLDQVYRYLAIDKKDELLELLNNKNRASLKISDVRWENLKIVWTAPKLPNDRPLDDKRIVWMLSEWYRNGDEYAVVLESEDNFFTKLIGEINPPKYLSVKDKRIIENWEPTEDLVNSIKKLEHLWRAKWQAEIEKWAKLKNSSNWKHQKINWKNVFCCLCGEGGDKEKFRTYPHPETHYWIFFNLTSRKIEIIWYRNNGKIKYLKGNIENVDKPMVCRECFLKIYKKLW